MEAADVYQLLSTAIWSILIGSGPVLLAALATGLIIALFQALTSVQEMTLTFVPKVLVILLSLLASLPLIYATLIGLSDQVFALIMQDGF